MLYPSINEIRKKADSRYTLVIFGGKAGKGYYRRKTEVDRGGRG